MGRDKALLPFRGSTFLNHLVSLLLPRVRPLAIVLGHHAEAIRETIVPSGDPDLRVVTNPRYKQGMLTSLQAGIRALPVDIPAALFTLVDHPAVNEATIDRLLRESGDTGAPVVVPRYRGERGHPVVVSRSVLDGILALPPDGSAKTVIREHRPETHFVDVDDPGVVTDVDLPGEYEALKKGQNLPLA